MSEKVISGRALDSRRKVNGGSIRVSQIAFKEFLGIEGQLRDIRVDPVTNSVELFYVGDADHFPTVYEGEYAPTLYAEITVDESKRRCKTVLVDPREGKRYQHAMHCEKGILLDEDFFDYLLNCMCNQKYVHEQEVIERISGQQVIDQVYETARKIQNIHLQSQEKFKEFEPNDKLLELRRMNNVADPQLSPLLPDLHAGLAQEMLHSITESTKKECQGR